MSISLRSLQKTRTILPPTVVLYGPGGIGKTTFPAGDPKLQLVGAPDPIFIFTERGQGLLNLTAYPFEDGIATSHDQILDALKELYTQEHDYKTLVIDSLDHWEPLLWKYTCEKFGQASINPDKGDFAFQRGYDAAVDCAREMFAGLSALRDEKGMAIVLLAHHVSKEFKDPSVPAYDRYRMKLQAKLEAFIFEWADHVLFTNYRVASVSDQAKFGKERRRGTGTGQRVIYTADRPAFAAKNRWSLPFEIPLSWEAFVAGMGTWTDDDDVQSSTNTLPAATPETQPEPTPQPKKTKK